jgi:hypothetical protein
MSIRVYLYVFVPVLEVAMEAESCRSPQQLLSRIWAGTQAQHVVSQERIGPASSI